MSGQLDPSYSWRTLNPGVAEGLQQAIIVRSDLAMSPGTLATVVADAAARATLAAGPDRATQVPVVLTVSSEEALRDLWYRAIHARLPCYLLNTPDGTNPALAIGPAPTGKLRPLILGRPLL